MTKSQKKSLSNVLLVGLGGTGIIDDYDEILADLLEETDIEHMTVFHNDVLVSVDFVNEFNDDCIEDHLNKQSFINTFDCIIDTYED